jgi:NADPH:quinone reductase-like Zn-dependent oxidoreductase
LTALLHNREYVQTLGAHTIIDYKHEDIRQRVKELTDNHGVDSVLNTISGKSATSAESTIIELVNIQTAVTLYIKNEY